MATLTKPTVEVKGKVKFTDADPLAVRLELEDTGVLKNNRRIQLDPDFLPEDFDPMKYEVSGEYVLKVFVKKR